MVKKQCQVWSQCAQAPPLSTRLTARHIWVKAKNELVFLKIVGFHVIMKDHLQGIVTPIFHLLLHYSMSNICCTWHTCDTSYWTRQPKVLFVGLFFSTN